MQIQKKSCVHIFLNFFLKISNFIKWRNTIISIIKSHTSQIILQAIQINSNLQNNYNLYLNFNFLAEQSRPALFEVLKSTLQLGQLEIFRFLYDIFHSTVGHHDFLNDIFHMLRTVGAPPTAFVNGPSSIGSCESSAHMSWFILQMLTKDYEQVIDQTQIQLCMMDVTIAELFVQNDSKDDKAKGADLHLFWSSIMKLRDLVYIMKAGEAVQIPPIRQHRFYEHIPQQQGGLEELYKQLASLLLTRGAVSDSNDEQLYPLLVYDMIKLRSFFLFMSQLSSIIPDIPLSKDLLGVLQALAWDSVFRIACEAFISEQHSQLLSIFPFLDLMYYTQLQGYHDSINFYRHKLLLCILRLSKLHEDQKWTLSSQKVRLINEIDHVFWESRANSARAFIMRKHALIPWPIALQIEGKVIDFSQTRSKIVANSSSESAYSIRDLYQAMLAVEGSIELIQTFCTLIEPEELKYILNTQLMAHEDLDESSIFVKNYKSSVKQLSGLKNVQDKDFCNQELSFDQFYLALNEQIRNSKHPKHFLLIILEKSITFIRDSNFQQAVIYTHQLQSLRMLILLMLWDDLLDYESRELNNSWYNMANAHDTRNDLSAAGGDDIRPHICRVA